MIADQHAEIEIAFSNWFRNTSVPNKQRSSNVGQVAA